MPLLLQVNHKHFLSKLVLLTSGISFLKKLRFYVHINCLVHRLRDFLVNTEERLAAEEPDTSLRGWWRPKTELKESQIWTYFHQVDKNMVPKQ